MTMAANVGLLPRDKMTVVEVAKELNVHRFTVERWTRRETNPLPFVRVGRRIWFSRAEVAAWMRGR